MKRLKRAAKHIFRRGKKNIYSPTVAQTAPEEQNITPQTHYLLRRNQSLPIARLLPEILLEVFLHYTHGAVEFILPSYLIRVTHVCHYWRELAISWSSLWAMVFLPSRAAHTFVARSLGLPLTLRCNLDYSSSQFIWILNSTRSRTKHLDLRGPRQMLGPVMEKDLGECCLSSLSVVNTTTDGANNEGGFWLPDSPFLTQLHSKPMSRLKLEACGFQWDSPLYTSGLTTLHLIDITELQRPSASRLFEILSELPGLMNLALVGVAPLDLEQYLGNLVPLRHLSYLRIEDQDFMCARLLSHLDTRPSATIAVVCSKGTHAIDVIRIFSASAHCCIADPIYTCLGLVVKDGLVEILPPGAISP